MGLRTTEFNKCLDKKLLILGYEIPDILAIFLLLSFLNLVLGALGSRLLLVWLPSLIFAIVLRVGKRGKPDNFLIHWIRFRLIPKKLSAFSTCTDWKLPPRLSHGRR